MKYLRPSIAFLMAVVPIRIIPLTPSLTEMVGELRPKDRATIIVGRPEFTDELTSDLPWAKDIPIVGPFFRPSLEAIISKKPNLILASKDGNPEPLVMRLQALSDFSLSKKIVIFQTRTLKDVDDTYIELGHLVDANDIANTIVATMKKTWDRLIQIHAKKKKPYDRAVIIVGINPIFVAGRNTLLSQMFEKLGIQNAFTETGTFFTPSMESLAALKKQNHLVLIDLSFSNDIDHKEAVDQLSRFVGMNRPLFRPSKRDLVYPSFRYLRGLEAYLDWEP